MPLHLAEIATEIAPGKHAVLLLDQAGWHLSRHLVVPATITLVPLPPKCPELNPVENVWQFLRDNWLSNRVFQLLRQPRRPLLRSVEPPRRSALEDHVDWPARVGAPVLIHGTWYKRVCLAPISAGPPVRPAAPKQTFAAARRTS